jgi:hypothetical protein
MLLVHLGLLFGQVNRQPPPPQQGDPAAGLLGCCCYGGVFVVALLVHILFLSALSRCLAECSPRNRTMEPGMVWLNLIPLFGLAWIFVTIIKLAESLDHEYRSRRMRTEDPDFGKTMGITYAVLAIIGCGPVALIFFIIYWVKIAGYKNELVAHGRPGRYDEYDDFDDRPRRRRPRDDDDEYDDDRGRRRREDDDYDRRSRDEDY